MKRKIVHGAMHPVSDFTDTWVSACGIFEPKAEGTNALKDVTCKRCIAVDAARVNRRYADEDQKWRRDSNAERTRSSNVLKGKS